MTITSGIGLISGIDFESMIARISAASRGPIQLLQQRQLVYQAKSESYGRVTAELNALRDQLRNMLSVEDFTFRKTSSTNEDVVGVSGGDEAAPGTYSAKGVTVTHSGLRASGNPPMMTLPP